MDIERYQALLSAIQAGSLSAAAEELGYTPSGISRMMAALEAENGFPLLVRSKDGVAPTAECEQMLPVIREFLFCGEQVRQRSAQIQHLEVGTLTVGTAYHHYYGWLAKTTADFHKAHPGIQIKIVNGYSSELLERVRQRTADMAIISQRSGDHPWIPLCQDSLIAMVSWEHPLSREAAIPVKVFETQPYIETYPGMDIDNTYVFRSCGVHPNTQFSTMDIYATYSMVKAGLGISMNNRINSIQWSGSIGLIPLDPPQQVTIGLAMGRTLTPAAQAFLHYISSRLPDKNASEVPIR